MAIVSTCVYDTRGRLVRPDRLEIGRAKISLDLDTGGSPTFEPGHVHVHTVTASGRNADHARQRLNARLARFADRAREVTGYQKIAEHMTQGTTPCNGDVTITCEILYTVEAPRWTRRHRAESRGAGYRRDRGAPAHR